MARIQRQSDTLTLLGLPVVAGLIFVCGGVYAGRLEVVHPTPRKSLTRLYLANVGQWEVLTDNAPYDTLVSGLLGRAGFISLDFRLSGVERLTAALHTMHGANVELLPIGGLNHVIS